jgi:hypothetical protein
MQMVFAHKIPERPFRTLAGTSSGQLKQVIDAKTNRVVA